MLSLSTLQDRQLSFLEFEFPEDQVLLGSRRSRKLERRRRIDEVFADYRRWVEETLTTEDSPFLRVAAVFLG
jgi:predicted transposase YdaD